MMPGLLTMTMTMTLLLLAMKAGTRNFVTETVLLVARGCNSGAGSRYPERVGLPPQDCAQPRGNRRKHAALAHRANPRKRTALHPSCSSFAGAGRKDSASSGTAARMTEAPVLSPAGARKTGTFVPVPGEIQRRPQIPRLNP